MKVCDIRPSQLLRYLSIMVVLLTNMHLLLLPKYPHIEELYKAHTTYHAGDSGLDVFFPESMTIEPQSTAFVKLGIVCEAFSSKGDDTNISYYLYPRSSISKTPLRMANSVGIIDAGYRGELMVAVDNTSTEDYRIEAGQRLFQICSPTLSPISYELTNVVSTTDRGEGGFGSTNAQ